MNTEMNEVGSQKVPIFVRLLNNRHKVKTPAERSGFWFDLVCKPCACQPTDSYKIDERVFFSFSISYVQSLVLSF